MRPSIQFFAVSMLFLGYGFAPGVRADDEDSAPEPPATALVQTAAVAVRDVAHELAAYGSVGTAPGQQRSMVALRDSEVSTIDVVAGVAVHKGAVLMTLQATPQAHAAYLQARSAADATHTALAQDRRLFAEHLITNAQLADSERAAADADANLKAQDAVGGEALATDVRAPSDGVVVSIAVYVGERVVTNDPLLAFSSTDSLYAQLGVSLEDAAQIKAGMPATVQAVFAPDMKAAGKVTQVGAGLDATSGLVEVLVRLAGKAALIPGSAVNGHIMLARVHGPAVPRSAVLHDDAGAYVFVVRGGTAHRVDVDIGPDDGQYIAVTRGVRAGDRVVTLGNYELEDGMAVREQSR